MTIINTVTTAPDIKTGAREVKPTSFPTEVLPPEGYNALSKATIVAPDNLEPENIKKGVDIAGVVGTLDAVAGASKLPQVVDRTVTEITAEDLKGCTKIGYNAFSNCKNLITVTIPDVVTEFDDSAFNRCYKLTSINIPDGLTKIGRYCFGSCYKLTTLTLPNSLTTLIEYAFADCNALESIILSSNLTSIPDNCFANDSSLPSIDIPASVTRIGFNAFINCDSLASVIMRSSTPPTLISQAFLNTSSDLVITVPEGSLSAYQSATNWSQYADKMVEASE